MMEKRWALVPPQLLTSNGTTTGSVYVDNAYLFKVKQEVRLGSSTQPTIELEVKRVFYPNVIQLGPRKSNIDNRSNLSTYLVADGAYLAAEEQKRSSVPEQEVLRNVYEEESVVALRTFLVDQYGNGYSSSSPLPVEIIGTEINIGSVSVDLTHLDNYPNPGDVADSVRIGDGEDELAINPDGSINVAITAGGTSVSVFDDANGVVSGIETVIVSYTVPIGFQFQVTLAEFDGDNIARYEFQVDGTVHARKHTWFNGDMYGQFDFNGALKVPAGSVVKLSVLHSRPDPGQFSGRILGVLV